MAMAWAQAYPCSLPPTSASPSSGRRSPPYTVSSPRGVEFEGAIIALFHLLLTRGDKVTNQFINA